MYYDMSNFSEEHSSNYRFALHSHEHYEIYMFIEGDSKYVVEGNTYSLEPYDIIVIRKHEMHRVYHNGSVRYRRFVLSVFSEFFTENNCTEYEKSFTDFSADSGNKIPSSLVVSSGIHDAILRLIKYSEQSHGKSTPVVKAVITEILYLISTVNTFSEADISKGPITDVISYINNHYTENISLDKLEKLFYISKYHICRLFKQITGLTVHEYIVNKRLIRACELKSEGISLSDAASMSGFCSYSAFYRAYINHYGTSPKSQNLS